MLGKEITRFGGSLANLPPHSVANFHLVDNIAILLWKDSVSNISGGASELSTYAVPASTGTTPSVIVRLAYWHVPSIRKLKLYGQTMFSVVCPSGTYHEYKVYVRCGTSYEVYENKLVESSGGQQCVWEDITVELDITELKENSYNEITIELYRYSPVGAVSARRLCLYGLIDNS